MLMLLFKLIPLVVLMLLGGSLIYKILEVSKLKIRNSKLQKRLVISESFKFSLKSKPIQPSGYSINDIELGREYWFLDKDNKIQNYIVIVVSFNQDKEVVINGYSPSMREKLKSKLERKYSNADPWYIGRVISYKNETVLAYSKESGIEELLNKYSIEKSYTFTTRPDQLYSSIEDLQNIQLVKKQEQYDRDLEKLQSQYNNDLDELFKP